MPFCKIFGCKSKARSGRSFFKVTNKNSETWMNIIKSSYPNDIVLPTARIVVCDLHFDPLDIVIQGERKVLVSDAVPTILQVCDIEDTDNALESERLVDDIDNDYNTSSYLEDQMMMEEAFNELNIFDEENSKDQDKISISMSEYRQLLNDSVKLQKANKIIERLKIVLSQKTEEIKALHKGEKRKSSEEMTFAEEILDCLKYGRPNKQYSEVIRQFCIALSYYGMNGYRYVRSVFNNNLPTPGTMRAWLSSVDSSPGITQQALTSLKIKADEYKENGKELFIALISDEMSIKKKVTWICEKKKFSGFVTCEEKTNDKNNQELPVAKNALVFMAVGKNFKIPVAYFFLTGLNALGRAALTQLTIKSVNDTGARVVSLTQDGLRANIAVAKEMGANFNNNMPYFPSPTNPNNKIYLIWDPPHMLKLARGCLKNHKLYYNGSELKWDFIVSLHEMQKKRNINLGNKLSDLHLNYGDKAMNVRLACETLSNSVADCIDQLRNDGYDEFKYSNATTEFIRYWNNIFDISNYKPNLGGAGNNFKRPLNALTANEFFEYFKLAKSYLQRIEIEETTTRQVKDAYGNKKAETNVIRKLVIESINYTPFFGYFHNMTAFEGLYTDLVLNGPLKELHTFQFCQDHLETWFSTVRSKLGYNDNPSAEEFKAIYRKLLVCKEIVYKNNYGNCISNDTQILTISSLQPQQIVPAANLFEEGNIFEIDFNYDEAIEENLGKFDQHFCAYVASSIEIKINERLKRCCKKECSQCIDIFEENEKVMDDFITRKNLTMHCPYPCKSTVNIIKATNKILDLLICEPIYEEHNMYNSAIRTIMSYLNTEELYMQSNFDLHTATHRKSIGFEKLTHKEAFICKIIDEYMVLKSRKIGSRISETEQGTYIRHTNKKRVHEAGQ